MMKRELVTLPTQVHFGSTPQLVPHAVAPLEPTAYARYKPRGGFWTSTLIDDGQHLTDWARWCHENWEGWLHGRTPWLLCPRTARIIVIDSHHDLLDVIRAFPSEPFRDDPVEHPDWHAIKAAGYDGVHLTDEGQWATRMSHPENLYGWDSESTLWFRWCFEGEPVEWNEHAWCHPEFHRCDGGGPGEYHRYVTEADQRVDETSR